MPNMNKTLTQEWVDRVTNEEDGIFVIGKLDRYCDKCESLRGSEPTLLTYCENNSCRDLPPIGGIFDGSQTTTVTYLCEGHCYDQFSMCVECFHFIQDPSNDEAIRNWERYYGRS